MTNWVIGAALASIVITALLTYLLWRVNAPALERARQEAARNPADGGGGEGAIVPASSRTSDRSDSHDDAGSDGGGDGGGGGGE